MDEKKNVPIPVGEVFPEALEELTNGKGDERVAPELAREVFRSDKH